MARDVAANVLSGALRRTSRTARESAMPSGIEGIGRAVDAFAARLRQSPKRDRHGLR